MTGQPTPYAELAEGCHQTFSTVANFDRHRTGSAEHRRCADPASVGLRLDPTGMWRGEPGTWRPPAHSPVDAQTAETGSLVGQGTPRPAETISGGIA